MVSINNLSKKKLKKMIMYLIKEDGEDSEKETDSIIELKRKKKPKMVNIRESFNVTTRGNPIHRKSEITSDTELYKRDPTTTIENMRSETELEMEEYTDFLKDEIEFDIPKSRNGRRLSAFGYAKSPHDAEYAERCNDGINGVSTA